MMKRVWAPPEWIPFPDHPSFWPGFSVDARTFGVKGPEVPWETTQLNITEKYLFDYTYIDVDDPPKFTPFDFEVYDWRAWAIYGTVNWHLPFLAGALYLFAIYVLQKFMKDRPGYNLKVPLFLWNAGLGIFSILGFIRTAPEFFGVILGEKGLYKAVCYRNGGNWPMAYWSLLFCLSKYVELGDTLFIILRKRPLVFIQWYHHFVTLITAWITAPYVEPIARWYVVMNYGVHSMMYPYFALRAIGINIPRKISIFITTCQLSQMLTGLFINFFTAFLIYVGVPCYRHPFSIKISAFVYGSFTILFGKLFFDIIIRNKNKEKSKSE